jgi:tetratricopeptide (TPR) repeat protein
VTGRAIRWIEQAGGRPWFVWVHVFDPHAPYDPPTETKKQFTAVPYDGEIAAVDRALGSLLRAADSSTIVAVAADHGESLGDHGEDSHGMFLYEAVLHVPLVIRTPNVGIGQRVSTRVRLADLAPTLLEAAGVSRPAAMQGQSLRLATADRPAYAETNYPRRAFGWSSLTSWRADRFLYIRAPKPELYDLVTDPDARQNIASTRPRVVDGIGRELDEFVRQTTGASSARTRVDSELAARLAALGYVSGTNEPAVTGIDPKDRIALANALQAAELAVDDGLFQKAIPLLEKVVASEPNVKLAQLQLGVSRAKQKQYSRALGPLAKAVELDPADMFAHYELALAQYETGDLRSAAAHFEIVATRLPKWADARYSLGSVWARIDRVPDAVRELQAALEIEPKHFRSNLLLGRILTLQGHMEQALPYLRTAVEVEPTNAEARQFLSDAESRASRLR